jgi:hypothetical protein
MIIKYEYVERQELWPVRKEAIDWLRDNVDVDTAYNYVRNTFGYKHSVGETQEQADEIWQTTLAAFRTDTGCSYLIDNIRLYQSPNWSLYSITYQYGLDQPWRYAIYISLPDDIIALQCKLALS